MNDQTAKADAGKLPLTLVPLEAIEDIAEVRDYGNKKYKSPDNWKKVEVQRYRDALFRHFIAYLRDPHGVDAESGIEHYKHLICNAAFICALERSNSDDDIVIIEQYNRQNCGFFAKLRVKLQNLIH